jgi:ADP-heptose:LPS heptosyltransferase
MGSGMARGAAARGKRIAFGTGDKIRWDQHSEKIFRGNPNIATPQQIDATNLEWIPFYKGHRIYNTQDGNRWVWNYDFHAQPGEVFLTRDEEATARRGGKNYIVMEPNVPAHKSTSVNKKWPYERYDAVSQRLVRAGFDVVQYHSMAGGHRLAGARLITTHGFRNAIASMARASLYIGPEGGLHHAAAAVEKPAVVIFGGFIPPSVTGYETHTNLTGGETACGSLRACVHCQAALRAITVEEVVEAALAYLKVEK